jgi:hypothetical protein
MIYNIFFKSRNAIPLPVCFPDEPAETGKPLCGIKTSY